MEYVFSTRANKFLNAMGSKVLHGMLMRDIAVSAGPALWIGNILSVFRSTGSDPSSRDLL